MIPFTGTSHEWNQLIASLPTSHLLQTWEWSQVKVKYGWQAMPFVWSGRPAAVSQPGSKESCQVVAAAMVLKRSFPIGGFAKRMCVLYIPKGPLMDWSDSTLRLRVLADLRALAKDQGAIFVKADPDVSLGTGIPGTRTAIEDKAGQEVRQELLQQGWKFSQDQIQFRNTVLIDLGPSENDLLAHMKQKTRYNLRLAQKKGVTVRIGKLEDLPQLYRMYAETSVRDGFLIRTEDYYQSVWHIFDKPSPVMRSSSTPFHQALIAEVEGQPVAALSLFYFAGQAIYLFGMSRDQQREKMPNHLLQWEAIRQAKALGCRIYNLWGAPDQFDESDGLWGVFRFKEGLGGYILRTIGAWDFTPSPFLYKLYTQTLPKVMDVMRVRGKAKTKQSLGA
jgi:peptidoglycan pentaglycine glycine transferase (the first glycine)